jgi:hypothetical protein
LLEKVTFHATTIKFLKRFSDSPLVETLNGKVRGRCKQEFLVLEYGTVKRQFANKVPVVCEPSAVPNLFSVQIA